MRGRAGLKHVRHRGVWTTIAHFLLLLLFDGPIRLIIRAAGRWLPQAIDFTHSSEITFPTMQAQGLTFVDAAYAWLITTGLEILLILVIAVIAIWLVRLVLKRAFGALLRSKIDDEARKRVDTLSSVIGYALTITIWAVAAIMVLGALGIEIGPVLAAAGVLGLAIGFGAQNRRRSRRQGRGWPSRSRGG